MIYGPHRDEGVVGYPPAASHRQNEESDRCPSQTDGESAISGLRKGRGTIISARLWHGRSLNLQCATESAQHGEPRRPIGLIRAKGSASHGTVLLTGGSA